MLRWLLARGIHRRLAARLERALRFAHGVGGSGGGDGAPRLFRGNIH